MFLKRKFINNLIFIRGKAFSKMPKSTPTTSSYVFGRGSSSKENQKYNIGDPFMQKSANHYGVFYKSKELKIFFPNTHQAIISFPGISIDTEFIGTKDFNGKDKNQYINTKKPLIIKDSAVESGDFSFTSIVSIDLTQELITEGSIAAVKEVIDKDTIQSVIFKTIGMFQEKRESQVFLSEKLEGLKKDEKTLKDIKKLLKEDETIH